MNKDKMRADFEELYSAAKNMTWNPETQSYENDSGLAEEAFVLTRMFDAFRSGHSVGQAACVSQNAESDTQEGLSLGGDTQQTGEPVVFTCHGNSAPAYSCNKPGDMSGIYYKAPQPQPDWVPVKEKRPNDGQRVIACYRGVYGPRIVTYWNGHFGRPDEPDGKGSQPATDWMSCPQPPEGE